MKCDLAEEKIALAVYGELPDDQRHELEQHLAACVHCRQELEQVQALENALRLVPVAAPSAQSMARARMRLEEVLDQLPARSWLARMSSLFLTSTARLAASPVATGLVLLAGVAAGGLGGYEYALRVPSAVQAVVTPQSQQNPLQQTMQIADVSSITRLPGSEEVQVNYSRLQPESITGSMEDPNIRQLLMLASENAPNPAVRMDSVALLAAECRAGHDCSSGPLRDTLMVALRYDQDPDVRLRALNGLQPYVGDDMQVRDAMLEALMNDSSSDIRQQTLGLLGPVQADSSVRQVLSTVALQDSNPAVRSVSHQLLMQGPQIQ